MNFELYQNFVGKILKLYVQRADRLIQNKILIELTMGQWDI